MRAFKVHGFADPAQSYVVDTDMPEIGPDEVLIRVAASAINPMDWQVQSGMLQPYLDHRLPVTLGWDVSGIVEQVGSAASGFSVGDRVYAMADITRDGCFAEFVAVKAEYVARAPVSLSLAEAAAVPLAALTAWKALFDEANLGAGQSILIHGAAGGVGSFAVQFAKWCGADVTATCSASAADLARLLGVDEVIDYGREDFSRRSGFDVVFDAIGGEVRERSWQVLKPRGKLVTIVLPDPTDIPRDDVSGVLVRNKPNGARLSHFAELIDAGSLQPLIAGKYELNSVADALLKSREGHVHGKLIIKIADIGEREEADRPAAA
jgi:NADPH:quinone reductase-like Zn-dependent oxidoreductase